MSVGTTELLIFLGIGLVAGWLAGLVLGGGGLLRNLIVGVIGAFVGGWLLSAANISLPIGNALVSHRGDCRSARDCAIGLEGRSARRNIPSRV